jgi:hypothetical protein
MFIFRSYLPHLNLSSLFSVAHADYKGPPRGFKPMEPMKKPTVVFDYLTPNDALPYPGLLGRASEAKV